jgi:KaiC/GvpD/RAD55 family RecA-like ATPase
LYEDPTLDAYIYVEQNSKPDATLFREWLNKQRALYVFEERVRERKAEIHKPNGANGNAQPSAARGFRVVNVMELLNAKLPPRELLLDPWLQTQGLVMVYGPRGTGKTHFSLGVAYALWSSGKFLNWQATRKMRVLFIDGEMPASVLQQRLTAIMAADARSIEVPAEGFNFITPDLLDNMSPPDLTDAADRDLLQERIDKYKPEVIILDNISTLCRSGRAENDAESWLTVQGWALRMRQQGRCVIFVHHAGKTGTQRGTSKREDVLDTVIKLSRPSDYEPSEGARFEVHFEKARHLHGDAAKPFEAWLQTDPSGRQSWTMKSLDESLQERIVALAKDGLTQKEIAEELGVNKSTVSRALAKDKEAA